MSKITDYPLVNSPDPGDVLLIDGTNGTRILPIEKAGIGLDATLTQAGKAADAKETGDRLRSSSSEVSELKSDFDKAMLAEENIDIASGAFSGTIYISPSSRLWTNMLNHKSGLYEVPLNTKNITIIGNASNKSGIGFLTSDDHVNGTSPDWATGENDLHWLEIGEAQTFKIPSDCTYVYLYLAAASPMDRAPESAAFKILFHGLALDNTLSVSGDAADAKVVGNKLDEINELSDTAFSYTLGADNTAISFITGAVYSSNGFQPTGYIDVSGYKTIIFARISVVITSRPTHGMAFYDEDKRYISGLNDGYNVETARYDDYEISVPANAKYARFTTRPAATGFHVFGVNVLRENISNMFEKQEQINKDSVRWLSGLVGMTHSSDGKFNVAARMRMMCDTEWTPINEVPRQRRVSGNLVYDSFPMNEPQKGIPYGAQLTYEQWMGKNISFETFLSALANPNSVMYDFSRVGTAYRASAWYSVNCSKAVSWALNLANTYATGAFASDPNINKIKNAGDYTVSDIQRGDILESPGVHTAIITDLVYNTFGELSQIEVSEAVTPTCRRKRWNLYGSFENFWEHFDGYNLLRYSLIDSVPPINMESMQPYISTSLGLNYGNKSNYQITDSIEITLLQKLSNTLIVKKDGTQIETIDVTNYDQSAIVPYTPAVHGWYAVGFDNDTENNYVAFCVNDNSASFDSETNKLTFSSTESNLFMVSYSSGSSRSHLSDVFPTAEDLTNGYMTLTIPSNTNYIHVTFANDYGKTIIEIAL